MSIKIITYNLCWEAFAGTKTRIDMRKCITHTDDININKCVINVGKIILNFTDDYDFMAFQEVSNKDVERINFPKLFIEKYYFENCKQNMDKVVTYYNKNKYTIKKVIKGNICFSKYEKRAYLGIIFNEKIIIINVHFPHKNYNKIIKKLIKLFSQEEEFSDPDYNIIICGDFNHEPDVKYMNRQLYKNNILNKKFYEKNNHFNTCCKPGGTYSVQFDNIFTTCEKPIIYKTLTAEEIGLYTKNNFTYTSDHLPVYIEFKNINLKEQIGGYNNLIELLDKKIIKYQNLQNNNKLEKLIYYKNYLLNSIYY